MYIILAMYLKLKYVDFLLIDIVYENGPIKFFCISSVFMVDVSIDTGLRTFLHLISMYKYSRFVMFDIFDRQARQGICTLNVILMLRKKNKTRNNHQEEVKKKYCNCIEFNMKIKLPKTQKEILWEIL